MAVMPLPLTSDVLVTYTLFENRLAQKKAERPDTPWSELVGRIRAAPTYIEKTACPLISLAEYGELRSDKNALRHAANVVRIYGIELDYDAGEVSLEVAARRLQDANLAAVLYTSPSHKPEAPRWRALLPLSEPSGPERREEYVARANRALGGIVTRESFVLSQSFYIGRVRGAEYEVLETSGRSIDLALDLEPQFHVDANNTGATRRDATTDAQLREAFTSGEDRYQAMLKLSARWAARGMAADDIEASLLDLLGNNSMNGDGIDLATRARPMADSAVRKFGETRAPRLPPPAPPQDFDPGEPPPMDLPPPEFEPEAPETERKATPLLAFTAEQLLAPIEPERYLCPGMVPTEAYTLIAGSLSAAKTTFLHSLMLWRATGFDALGLTEEGGGGIEMGPCVLVSYEDSDSRIVRRFQRLVQHQHQRIASIHGARAAAQYLANVEINIRRVTLTGQYGAGIIKRHEGAIVENGFQVDCLLRGVGAFAKEGVFIGIDPLRLAIVGSQNDDDGADVAVHVLNHIANYYPHSGVVIPSHTTKSQAKEGGSGMADAAYATSGSALYSQHARSNFHLSRLTSEQMRSDFPAACFTDEEVAKQMATRLVHGRLSHGSESNSKVFAMRTGVLEPVDSGSESVTVFDVARANLPVVRDAIERIRLGGGRPSFKALESDREASNALRGRNRLRDFLRLAIDQGWVEESGSTNTRSLRVTSQGDALIGESRRES